MGSVPRTEEREIDGKENFDSFREVGENFSEAQQETARQYGSVQG